MKNAGIVSAVVLGVFALAILAAVLNGVMLSYMWQWFIVPLGVRAIAIPQAIGIAVIAAMLTHEGADTKSDEAGEGLNRILVRLLAKVIAFGIAFGLSFMVPA